MIADDELKEKTGRTCGKAGYLCSMSNVQFLGISVCVTGIFGEYLALGIWTAGMDLLRLLLILFLFAGDRDASPASYLCNLPLGREQKEGGAGSPIEGSSREM